MMQRREQLGGRHVDVVEVPQRQKFRVGVVRRGHRRRLGVGGLVLSRLALRRTLLVAFVGGQVVEGRQGFGPAKNEMSERFPSFRLKYYKETYFYLDLLIRIGEE